jgi:hypothetical protein
MFRCKIISFPLFALLASGCIHILESKEKVLANIVIPKAKYSLKLISFPSNATVERSIQVRKSFNDGKMEVIKDFEKYDSIEVYKLLNDSVLMLVLRDTVSYLGNKPDTFKINIAQ